MPTARNRPTGTFAVAIDVDAWGEALHLALSLGAGWDLVDRITDDDVTAETAEEMIEEVFVGVLRRLGVEIDRVTP